MKMVGDPFDVPFQAGDRVIVLAFSPVTALLEELRLPLMAPDAFIDLCANLCLAATPAEYDSGINAVIRRPNEIGQAFAEAVHQLHPHDVSLAQSWVLQGHNGGAAGPDPRYFWKAALKWAAGLPDELTLEEEDRRSVVDFAARCFEDIANPDWQAQVDKAITAPYSARDIEIAARLQTGLLQDAAVGDAINPISVHLEPVRAWRIIEQHWRALSPQERAAVDQMPFIWAQTAGRNERVRGGPVEHALCPLEDVLADA